MMLTQFNRTMLASVVTIVAISGGCGMFSTKNKGQKARENDSQLAGQWQAECAKKDWLGFSYQRQTFQFSVVGDFDRTTALFSDEGCVTALTTLIEHGTYASLGESSAVAGSREINLTITQASIKPHTDDGAKLLNDVGYCDITTWERDRSDDVLGKNCAGTTHPSGEVVFDIYSIEDGGKRLLTGKGSLWVDKSEANLRPTKLDDVRVYTKM
jgi:hypothetical protein